jgi:hypothetical protein
MTTRWLEVQSGSIFSRCTRFHQDQHVHSERQRTAPEEAPVKIRRRSVCHRAAIGPASPPSRVDRANPCRQLTRLLGLTTQAEHFSCCCTTPIFAISTVRGCFGCPWALRAYFPSHSASETCTISSRHDDLNDSLSLATVYSDIPSISHQEIHLICARPIASTTL